MSASASASACDG
ncbi:unnamed protein product, partial [Didymodactylos carnosus]